MSADDKMSHVAESPPPDDVIGGVSLGFARNDVVDEFDLMSLEEFYSFEEVTLFQLMNHGPMMRMNELSLYRMMILLDHHGDAGTIPSQALIASISRFRLLPVCDDALLRVWAAMKKFYKYVKFVPLEAFFIASVMHSANASVAVGVSVLKGLRDGVKSVRFLDAAFKPTCSRIRVGDDEADLASVSYFHKVLPDVGDADYTYGLDHGYLRYSTIGKGGHIRTVRDALRVGDNGSTGGLPMEFVVAHELGGKSTRPEMDCPSIFSELFKNDVNRYLLGCEFYAHSQQVYSRWHEAALRVFAELHLDRPKNFEHRTCHLTYGISKFCDAMLALDRKTYKLLILYVPAFAELMSIALSGNWHYDPYANFWVAYQRLGGLSPEIRGKRIPVVEFTSQSGGYVG